MEVTGPSSDIRGAAQSASARCKRNSRAPQSRSYSSRFSGYRLGRILSPALHGQGSNRETHPGTSERRTRGAEPTVKAGPVRYFTIADITLLPAFIVWFIWQLQFTAR